MMQEIHVFFSYLVKIVFTLDAHCRDFYPVTVLPIAARCRYFTKINLRIEIRGKCITMVTTITIQNIYGINGIELML